MADLTLKPLPEPAARRFHYDVRGFDVVPPTLYYTAAQVEQIRRDAVRDALGAAVKACDSMAIYAIDAREYWHNSALAKAAYAIRALMPKEEGK